MPASANTMELSSTAYVILGLLRKGPKSEHGMRLIALDPLTVQTLRVHQERRRSRLGQALWMPQRLWGALLPPTTRSMYSIALPQLHWNFLGAKLN